MHLKHSSLKALHSHLRREPKLELEFNPADPWLAY
jgi:hypothetical protein